MTTVTIDWPYSHDARDDYDSIRQLLEAGGDEGPLLVVPEKTSRSGPTRTECQIFRDADSYVAHLAMGDGEVKGERWIGLVRGSYRENKTTGLAVLSHLKGLLDSRVKRRLKNESLGNDHFVLVGPFRSEEALAIENGGDGFGDLSAAFPVITEQMKLDEWSPAGRITFPTGGSELG